MQMQMQTHTHLIRTNEVVYRRYYLDNNCSRTPANVLLPSRSKDVTNDVLPTFPSLVERRSGREQVVSGWYLSVRLFVLIFVCIK